MNGQAVTKHRRKRRIELIKIMGGKCAICGYNKCDAALQLHHLDPSQKEYSLSSGNCKSIEEDINEAKKCILVCANCHREIHNGFYDNLKLKPSFNQDIADQVLQEYKNVKQKTFTYCKTCGRIITPGAIYCEDCYKKIVRNNSHKSEITREQLKQKIRTMPFVQIGKQYGVTDNAIRKWCDTYNLPRTKKEINYYSDDQWKKI